MRTELLSLIQKYNVPERGLFTQSDLTEYVNKIVEKATILVYYENGLKAFIAFYCNDKNSLDGYLSLILVDDEVKGKRIGKLLLNSSIDILRRKGFKNYELDVLKINNKAIELYEDLGFGIVSGNNLFYRMKKII